MAHCLRFYKTAGSAVAAAEAAPSKTAAAAAAGSPAKAAATEAAGLTTNMIANMGKGKNISMETLVRICEALNCGILDVIELEKDDE